MKASSIELLKDAYGGTFEENVKTVLTKHFDSDSAENLWNQIVEKYSELFQKQNISEEVETNMRKSSCLQIVSTCIEITGGISYEPDNTKSYHRRLRGNLYPLVQHRTNSPCHESCG